MTTKTRNLYDVGWPAYAEIINSLLMGKVRLTAMMSVMEGRYFLSKASGEFTEVRPGPYVICQTHRMIETLEEVYYGQGDAPSFEENAFTSSEDYANLEISNNFDGPLEVSLSEFISPDGERGLITDAPNGDYEEFLSRESGVDVPFARIIVEECEGDQEHHDIPIKQRNRQSDLDYLITLFFKENPTGGYPGFARFLKEQAGADFTPGDKWRWQDAEGKPQVQGQKTIKERLTKLRPEPHKP